MKDKNGKVIKEFDLLKVYHFTGARKKKYYMYKWVKRDKSTGHLMGHSLNYEDHCFNLYSAVNNDLIWEDAEIIQRGCKDSHKEDI